MREIKFKIWSEKPNQSGIISLSTSIIASQYVGFSDKNNTEIYTGDILEMAGGSQIIVNDLAEFLIYCGRYEEKHGVSIFDCLTVMGNIYETPELL